MKNWFSRIYDMFSEAFGEILLLFWCSLALPLAVGLLGALGEGADIMFNFGKRQPYIYYGASIIVGIYLKSKVDERNAKKE
jgi:hypothetical protein